MSEGIIVAVVSGVLTLIGTIITVYAGNIKTQKSIEITQAVTNNKLENLKEEVSKHNKFAERIPAIEQQIRDIDRRVGELEHGKN